MKRVSAALLCILLLCAISAAAGRTGSDRVSAYVRGNPLRSASNLHCYEVLDSSVTVAPRGYTPFYISHLGRHGSRGHSESTTYAVVDTLVSYRDKGLLTEEGVRLTELLCSIRARNEKEGFGNLTDRGAWEHREIARRMAEHYPEVFSDPSRTNVNCYSTSVPRVIASCDNFIASLSAAYPGLNISKRISLQSPFYKYQVGTDGLTKEEKKLVSTASCNPFRDSLLHSLADWNRLTARIFASGTAPEEIRGHEGRFFAKVHRAGTIRQCYLTDTLGWVEPYFNADELYAIWANNNVYHSHNWAWTTENRGLRVRNCAVILKNIIFDADAVIAGADTCATLRFSHDAVVQPVLCLMGVDWSDWHGPFRQVNEHYCIARTVQMAGNVQLVFLRNRRGHVLVKILLNEQETTIPELKPDRRGVFYDWERLKAYFNNRILCEQ